MPAPPVPRSPCPEASVYRRLYDPPFAAALRCSVYQLTIDAREIMGDSAPSQAWWHRALRDPAERPAGMRGSVVDLDHLRVMVQAGHLGLADLDDGIPSDREPVDVGDIGEAILAAMVREGPTVRDVTEALSDEVAHPDELLTVEGTDKLLRAVGLRWADLQPEGGGSVT